MQDNVNARKQTQIVIIAIIIMIYVLVILLNWNRLHYSVEISDEAYSIAEAYIVSNGAIPFSNNWSQSPGAALLYAPLVKLYTSISGGTEGIFLFMRQAFLIYQTVISGGLMLLFKRHFALFLSMLLPLPYLSLSPLSISNFNYNTISLSLLLISTVFVFIALKDKERHSNLFMAIGGMLMALTILTHLMQIFTATYTVIILFLVERKRFNTWHRTIFFVLGGLSVALAVVIYLSILSNGFMPIIKGIISILHQPYFHVKKVGLNYNISSLQSNLLLYKDFFIIGLFIFGIILLAAYMIRKRTGSKYIDIKTIYIIALLLAQYLYLYKNLNSESAFNVIICYTFILLLLLPAANWKKNLDLVLLVFFPFALTYLLNIPFNWSGLSSRGYILFPAAILSIGLTYLALEDIAIPKTAVCKNLIIHGCTSVLAVAVATIFIMGYYGYVYRDSPISELTYEMPSGVYRGLYTVEARGKALLYLEAEINKVTNREDKILFMDQAPEAYLMTKANHCTPSTWDILLYTYAYGNNLNEKYDSMNDYLLQEYFRVSGKEPDKIIYVQDKERLEHISLWNEKYKFNQYVKLYYKQTYANNAAQFAIIVFERNEE